MLLAQSGLNLIPLVNALKANTCVLLVFRTSKDQSSKLGANSWLEVQPLERDFHFAHAGLLLLERAANWRSSEYCLLIKQEI